VLTADLARTRTRGGNIQPLFIDPGDERYRETAAELIQIFKEHLGRPKGELEDTTMGSGRLKCGTLTSYKSSHSADN
jgi:predicted nuclease of restriction endonuclease-like RecB superfamily